VDIRNSTSYVAYTLFIQGKNMALDFSTLKQQSGSSSIKNLTEEIAKLTPPKNGPDERFWNPTVDKAGNGMAIIRFLAAPPGETVPFVKIHDHGFQGPTGKWYIENSLTTFSEDDPVSKYNSDLWNSGIEKNKEIARKQKRRLHFFSNILVIDDPAKPECNGKVFLFKYGKKIFQKLSETTTPQFTDEEAFNPFDMWEGANFKLKIRNVEGYRNYDRSEFDKVHPISKNDEEIERIWRSTYSLQELIDRKNFKSYADLERKFNQVINVPIVNTETRNEIKSEDPPTIKVASKPSIPTLNTDVDDDEDLEYFKKLANSK
jgi:hypothetical protein